MRVRWMEVSMTKLLEREMDGDSTSLVFMLDGGEERGVEAGADGWGMRRLGCGGGGIWGREEADREMASLELLELRLCVAETELVAIVVVVG
jgi:hypothetical protein